MPQAEFCQPVLYNLNFCARHAQKKTHIYILFAWFKIFSSKCCSCHYIYIYTYILHKRNLGSFIIKLNEQDSQQNKPLLKRDAEALLHKLKLIFSVSLIVIYLLTC